MGGGVVGGQMVDRLRTAFRQRGGHALPAAVIRQKGQPVPQLRGEICLVQRLADQGVDCAVLGERAGQPGADIAGGSGDQNSFHGGSSPLRKAAKLWKPWSLWDRMGAPLSGQWMARPGSFQRIPLSLSGS